MTILDILSQAGQRVALQVISPTTYGYQPSTLQYVTQPLSSTTQRQTSLSGIVTVGRTTAQRLTKTQQVQFITREASKIDRYIKNVSQTYIPTLRDVQRAGYNYGKAHPTQAKMVLATDLGLDVISKVTLKPRVGKTKTVQAFADGAIKGIRNEPVQALAMVALPGVVGAAVKGARYIPAVKTIVNSPKAMKFTSAAIGAVYTKNIYDRVNAPVFDGYKKEVRESQRKLPDGSTEITQTITEIPQYRKPTNTDKSERLGYIWSTEVGPMAVGEVGLKAVSKVKFDKLSAQPTKRVIKKVYDVNKAGVKRLIKSEKAEATLTRRKKVKAKLEQKQKQKEIVVSVAKTEPIVVQKGEIVVLDFTEANRMLKLEKGLKSKTVAQFGPKNQLQIGRLEYRSIEQQVKDIQVTVPKIKSINVELKKQRGTLISQQNQLSKVKTKTQSRQITNQITITKSKIKALQVKRSKLVVLLGKKLNQVYGSKSVTKSISKASIKEIQKQRAKSKAKTKAITKPKAATVTIPKEKPKDTTKQKAKIRQPTKPKTRTTPKPKTIQKPIPKPIPLKFKTTKPKKAKKKKYAKYKYDFERKNPVATLQDLIG